MSIVQNIVIGSFFLTCAACTGADTTKTEPSAEQSSKIVAQAAPTPAPTCKGECDGNCHGSEHELGAIGDKVETVPVDGAPARGALTAPITVVEFADFECTFCTKSEATLKALEAAHPGQLKVVFKNMPLPFHKNARLAAKAALAADAQGHFWEYHDVLFTHRDALDRASLERYAADLRLDTARFAKDLDDARLDARIDADVADAKELGVKGTPAFFVNGRHLIGAQPLSTFEAAIAKR